MTKTQDFTCTKKNKTDKDEVGKILIKSEKDAKVRSRFWQEKEAWVSIERDNDDGYDEVSSNNRSNGMNKTID